MEKLFAGCVGITLWWVLVFISVVWNHCAHKRKSSK